MSNLKTSDLIRSTRQLVQGNARSPVNTLASQKLAASNTAVLTYPISGVQIGSLIEIGWVAYSVVDIDVVAKTLTVLEEVPGTAVDAAAGDRVTIRPRYTIRRIITELNNDLMDLSTHGIYKLRSVAAADGVVTVPVDALVVLDVWDLDNERNPGVNWRIVDTPTGAELYGARGLDFVVFGCTFGELSYTTDVDLDTVGLVSPAEDLPPLGAAIRLLAGAESQRNLIDTQGETRRAEEVQAGALSGSMRNLVLLRQSRLVAEASRYQQRYGIKMHVAI